MSKYFEDLNIKKARDPDKNKQGNLKRHFSKGDLSLGLYTQETLASQITWEMQIKIRMNCLPSERLPFWWKSTNAGESEDTPVIRTYWSHWETGFAPPQKERTENGTSVWPRILLLCPYWNDRRPMYHRDIWTLFFIIAALPIAKIQK